MPLVAVLFSACVGIAAGLFPALKAAKLDPLDLVMQASPTVKLVMVVLAMIILPLPPVILTEATHGPIVLLDSVWTSSEPNMADDVLQAESDNHLVSAQCRPHPVQKATARLGHRLHVLRGPRRALRRPGRRPRRRGAGGHVAHPGRFAR